MKGRGQGSQRESLPNCEASELPGGARIVGGSISYHLPTNPTTHRYVYYTILYIINYHYYYCYYYILSLLLLLVLSLCIYIYICVCVHICTSLELYGRGFSFGFSTCLGLLGIPGSLGAIMPERMYLQAAPFFSWLRDVETTGRCWNLVVFFNIMPACSMDTWMHRYKNR